jgi:hypothetical protein
MLLQANPSPREPIVEFTLLYDRHCARDGLESIINWIMTVILGHALNGDNAAVRRGNIALTAGDFRYQWISPQIPSPRHFMRDCH